MNGAAELNKPQRVVLDQLRDRLRFEFHSLYDLARKRLTGPLSAASSISATCDKNVQVVEDAAGKITECRVTDPQTGYYVRLTANADGSTDLVIGKLLALEECVGGQKSIRTWM